MNMARPALVLLLLSASCADSPDRESVARTSAASEASSQSAAPARPAQPSPPPSAPAPRQEGAAVSLQAAATDAATATVAFLKRVSEYLELRSAIAKVYPEVKETGDPGKISAREQALGQAIANARWSAKAGDIFGAEMSPHLVRILAEDWESRSPADRKALFGEVPPGLELKVNQPYPTSIPLVSVPAQLLARLPTLPEALEYRLVDRRLLLRDRDANVIVDVLVGVPPKR
jgi:hypothetical protein